MVTQKEKQEKCFLGATLKITLLNTEFLSEMSYNKGSKR
jgi:hypothetical protein